MNPGNFFSDSILDEIEENEDGSFQILNRDGFAILVVQKPGKYGRAITYKEVCNRLEIFGIEEYDNRAVEEIVKLADGKEYQVAEWKGATPQDSRLEVYLSEDSMQAFAKMSPPKNGGKTLRTEDIEKHLQDAGVIHGIKHDVIEDIVIKQLFFTQSLIAEGTPPTASKNGEIQLKFQSHGKPSPEEDAHGKVDYKNIGVIQTVAKGDLLAVRTQSQPGTPGKSVLGGEIPSPPGLLPPWKLGVHCYLSEDENSLYAEIEGRPVIDRDGSIRVDEVCLLENVDYSTGNVDFPGTIIVEGRIADDFRLKTKGSLIIKKSIGRVFLHAEGDIVLSGGVMGRSGGLIESESDIYAKFAEQANLKAGKSIFITEASMHSNLVAGKDILLEGGRGELIGGEAIAGGSILANKIGAVVETKTSLLIGIPPKVLNEIDVLKKDIADKTAILEKITITLSKLQDIAAKKDLTAEEQAMLTKLKKAYRKFSDTKKNLLQQYEDFIAKYEPSPKSYVKIEKTIFPRVNVNFGKGKKYNSEIKSTEGKNYIYLTKDGLPTCSNEPPEHLKKE